MEVFAFPEIREIKATNMTIKREVFLVEEKLIFHNYLPLIDKSKYWHHVSLLLVWRGDNSQV